MEANLDWYIAYYKEIYRQLMEDWSKQLHIDAHGHVYDFRCIAGKYYDQCFEHINKILTELHRQKMIQEMQ